MNTLMDLVVTELAVIGGAYLVSELVKGIKENPDIFLEAVSAHLRSRCNPPVKTMRYQRVEWLEVTEWTGYVSAQSE